MRKRTGRKLKRPAVLELDAIDNVYLVGSVMGLSLREIRVSLDEILAFAELERFADQAGIPRRPVLDVMQNTMLRITAEWSVLAERDFLPPRLDAVITQQIKRFSL